MRSDRDGDILLEVSDSVRQSLIADMDDHELLAAAKEMDADELADLAPELPRDVVHELMETLDAQQRERVRSALSYDEEQVGALMDFEMVTIREDVSLEVVLRYLRRLKELPNHTDKLFVVDYDGILKGYCRSSACWSTTPRRRWRRSWRPTRFPSSPRKMPMMRRRLSSVMTWYRHP